MPQAAAAINPPRRKRRDVIDISSPEAATKGLQLDRFEKMLWEINNQPTWRLQADIEADYYDGNQLDSDTLAEMADRGIPPLVTNLIAPTIDTVLGMEAKSRTDWKVIPDEEGDDEPVALALNVKLHEAERISGVDRAVSDAYAGQIKTGLHWVEVSREFDPLKPKYRVKAVHRREIWWDWFAKEPDLSDARYLIRKRWFDEDLVLMMFPKHAELIKAAVNGWHGWDYDMGEVGNTWLMRQWGLQQNSSIDEMEWMDAERDRLCLHECWYREWVKSKVIRLPNDSVIEFDPSNPRHAQVAALGLVRVEAAVLSKVRLSWWLGPHRLVDMPTPYSHNHFPYVPFFGKREDRTGVPYGMIRSMISPQDQVNARESKMMWLLSSIRVQADEDAVRDHDAAAREVGRPNSYIKLNKDRLNKTATAFQVDNNNDLSAQQFHALESAKQHIQDTAGVYQQMLGKDVAGGATSGIAINSLVEQGTITLAEINDNYRYSRMQVGELLLSMVKDDIGILPVTVKVWKGTEREQSITLNETIPGQDASQVRTNDVVRTKTRVILEDVPNTPSYRAQQTRDLQELTKALPPEIQAAIIDMVIEGMDHPRKEEVADRIRGITGMGKKPEKMSDEERAAAEEQAAFSKQMQELQLREQIAKTALAENNAELAEAKTEKTLAETAKLEQDADHEIENHALQVAQGAKQLTQPDPKPGQPARAK